MPYEVCRPSPFPHPSVIRRAINGRAFSQIPKSGAPSFSARRLPLSANIPDGEFGQQLEQMLTGGGPVVVSSSSAALTASSKSAMQVEVVDDVGGGKSPLGIWGFLGIGTLCLWLVSRTK